MPRYAHLLAHDSTLLEQFLTVEGQNYTDIHFDVHVGEGTDPGEQFSIEIRRMSISLSQRRIDCVAISPTSIHIIEVTHNAGMTALGQCLAYPALYVATYNPDLPVIPLLLTRTFKPGMKELFEFYSIPFYLIPEPLPSSNREPSP